jgi:hypothetical protein
MFGDDDQARSHEYSSARIKREVRYRSGVETLISIYQRPLNKKTNFLFGKKLLRRDWGVVVG